MIKSSAFWQVPTLNELQIQFKAITSYIYVIYPSLIFCHLIHQNILIINGP